MRYFRCDRPRLLMQVLACLSFATAALAEDGAPIEFVRQVGHASGMFGVFSPDGTRVLSGSDDTTLKLWDAGTGQLIRTFRGHSGNVTSIAFSPDGERVLSGSDDSTIKLWNARTGALLHTFPGNTYLINSVAYSPDGTCVASAAGDGAVNVWDRCATARPAGTCGPSPIGHLLGRRGRFAVGRR